MHLYFSAAIAVQWPTEGVHAREKESVFCDSDSSRWLQLNGVTIWYDTIYLRALKSWRYGRLSLADNTETKNLGKTTNKNRLAQKKRCRQSPWRQSERNKCNYGDSIREGGRFFEPGVKERGSYGWAEWWIRRGRSDGWRNGELGMAELVLKWGKRSNYDH